jgi:anion-transporting  ArsA/GET3 family ATPase
MLNEGAAVSLGPIIESRRIILCLGSGGVGKTTTAAALGVAGAVAGKRVLCLTIDPARRLAQSLGLSDTTLEAQRVAPARFREAGLRPKGSLAVMVLDTKRTFDDLIRRHASSTRVSDRIIKNRLYDYVSGSLGGTREYMAVEKVFEIKDDPAWDLLILDTPPTTNALDFLDAPERLIGAIDSLLIRWLVAAFSSSHGGMGLLARGAAAVLSGLGKLTGQGFLESIAEFLASADGLLAGFRARAAEVSRSLRGKDVACVLITSPDPMSIRETLFLNDRLKSLRMPRSAVVANRVHTFPQGLLSPEDVEAAIERASLDLGPKGKERVMRAVQDATLRAVLDRGRLEVLGAKLGRQGPIRVDVPAFAGDVHDIRALARVANALI